MLLIRLFNREQVRGHACYACCAGSPIISRQGWRALLAEQGFMDVLVAGESLPAAALLSRQSVVVGFSDGAIQIARRQPAPTPKPGKGGAPVPATPGHGSAAPGQQQLAAPSTAAIIQVESDALISVRPVGPSQVAVMCDGCSGALQELQSLISGLVGASVPADQPLMEAGLDSIGAVELRNAVGARFGVDLPAMAAFDHPTAAALAQYVGQRAAAEQAGGNAPAGAAAAMQRVQQQRRGTQLEHAAIAAQLTAVVSELLGFAVPDDQVKASCLLRKEIWPICLAVTCGEHVVKLGLPPHALNVFAFCVCVNSH